MITNRMRRMSKRRQKIELRRQARLIAQAVDLNVAIGAVSDPIVANVAGEQPASSTPAAS
jgi:hypothetical protein